MKTSELNFQALAKAQTHRGTVWRQVYLCIPAGSVKPIEAMEIALSILDAARTAEVCPAPEYPGLFVHEGDPMRGKEDAEKEVEE